MDHFRGQNPKVQASMLAGVLVIFTAVVAAAAVSSILEVGAKPLVLSAHPINLTSVLAMAETARSNGVDVTVALAAGRFALRKPLKFGRQPGTLHLQGHPAGSVLSGGVPLVSWEPVPGKPWLFQCALPGDVTNVAVSQLWVAGLRRSPARTPLQAYAHTCSSMDSCTTVWTKPGQLLSYTKVTEMRVTLYHSWTASVHALSNISMADNTFSVKNPYSPRFDGGGANSGNRFYLENAPELLAPQAGSFFFDSQARIIQYAPTATELASGSFRTQSFVANLTELVATVNGSNVHLDNIIFEHAAVDYQACYTGGTCDGQSADFLTTAALHWTQSSQIYLTNVTIRHVGGYGVWFAQGSQDCLLSRSTLYDLGAGGVRIGEGRSGIDPLHAVNVTVSDSFLSDGGYVYREGCGVLMQAAAHCTVTHCDIHDFHYTGVSIGWTWLVSVVVSFVKKKVK